MKFARLLLLAMTLALTAPVASAQNVDPSGDWRGVLRYAGFELRLAMHLDETPTFDSPDQNAYDLPSTVRVEGRRVTVEVIGIAAYVGELSEDGALLVGEWRQGEAAPLNFERGRF